MSIRVIISDNESTGHPETMRTELLSAYGDGLSVSEIEIRTNAITNDLLYASQINAECFVRSITGGIAWSISELYYPDILCFTPLGSNDYVELSGQEQFNSIGVNVTSGAGDSSNRTGYGFGLEFWDTDGSDNSVFSSSFSNARVAGKLLKIKDSLSCSWWEARYRARKTASNLGVWDKYNGYGLISVSNAIAYDGNIPLDSLDSSISIGVQRLSDNFKFWGQTDVTFAELTKSFAYYERISGL